ncbi:MAG: hypothetical protein ACQESP_07320 [Candidatus Muiribacteriota bacterium]
MEITILKNELLLSHKWHITENPDPQGHIHMKLYEYILNKKNIKLIDCGNRFNPYFLARVARYSKVNINQLLERIQISRVFTIYQLKNRLKSEKNSRNIPVFLSDIDKIIEDESISETEMTRLTEICVLSMLEIKAPILLNAGGVIAENCISNKISQGLR